MGSVVYRSIPDSYAATVASAFARNLIRLRKAAGLNQERLGEKAGMKQGRISKYETDTEPSLHTLLQLAIGLRRPVADLLAGVSAEYDALFSSETAPPAADAVIVHDRGLREALSDGRSAEHLARFAMLPAEVREWLLKYPRPRAETPPVPGSTPETAPTAHANVARARRRRGEV